MAIQIGQRPPELHGCWKEWQEQYVDVIGRTEFETGDMRTRRRFTGRNRVVNATVTYPAALYNSFMNWFLVAQRQGAFGTNVRTPYETEEIFQWTAPPVIKWEEGAVAFTASVQMFQGDEF